MFNINKLNESLIALEGRFDASQVQKVENFLADFNDSFSVDMTNLEYISSAGLGILLRTLTRLKANSKSLILQNMNKHIREVLKYSGLDKIFTIKENV